MQITSFTSLAAIALTPIALAMGAAAAQSAPRVLQIDETPAVQGVRATAKPAEVRVLRPADGGEVVLSPSATVLGTGGALGGLQEAAQQGFLGVQLGGEGEGAEVMGLVDGSPAQQAKLQAGDRIMALDGERIASSQALTAAIRGKRPGTVVKLSIARGDDELVQEVTLGTRGGAVEAPAQAHEVAPRQIELRTLDIDDDGAGDGDGPPKKVRVRIGQPQAGVAAPDAEPKRIEVRKEVRQDGDGEPEVKVWVNGEEVDPGTMGGHWFGAEGDGEFEVQLEGLEGLVEQHVGGGHTFHFDGMPGKDGQFVIVHPGGKGGHGALKVEGHALPHMMLHGGVAPELQRRVDELEGQVQRLEEHVRSLEQMVRELRGGNQAPPGSNRGPGRNAGQREGDSGPSSRSAHGGGGNGPRAGGPQGGAAGGGNSGEGSGGPRSGGDDTDELRREMRELMRAIERLERQGGGQGGGQSR